MNADNKTTRTDETVISSKAVAYYKTWTMIRFPYERLYIVVSAIISVLSYFMWWLVSQRIGGELDFVICVKVAVIASACASFFILISRIARVMTSWIVAKQVLDLMRAGECEKPWRLLVARYRDIHPLVVNKLAFMEILVGAVEKAKNAGDVSAQDILTADRITCMAWQSRSDKEIDQKAKSAIKALIVCFVLIVLTAMIRLVSR